MRAYLLNPSEARVQARDSRATSWRATWLWARMHPVGVVSAAVLVVVVVACVGAPVLASYSPNAIHPTDAFAAPSIHHLFGTDELGRDLFTRVLYGGRLSLLLCVSATIIALTAGGMYGALAALRGGVIDEALMRAIDGVLAIPIFLLALIALVGFGFSSRSLLIILGLLQAPWTARVVRAACVAELRRDYCTAAITCGLSRARLLRQEVLPNIVPTLATQANVVLASSLILEASLSFVGVGVQPPQASWGTMLLDGYNNIYSSISYVVGPLCAICITTVALNLLADEISSAGRAG